MTASLAFSRGCGAAVWTLALRTIVGGGGDRGQTSVRGKGRGSGRWFGAGSFGYSLLECLFCKFAVSSCLPLAGQTAHSRVPAGFRLCIHIMSMLKAVHSPRRAVDFVRISFEKLTNPRLKWLAALVKFQDGKEFEPRGNAFKVTGDLTNAATLAAALASLDGLSAFLRL